MKRERQELAIAVMAAVLMLAFLKVRDALTVASAKAEVEREERNRRRYAEACAEAGADLLELRITAAQCQVELWRREAEAKGVPFLEYVAAVGGLEERRP